MTVLSESEINSNQTNTQSNEPTDATFNEVTANRFVGNVVGNATTATQLQNNFSVVFRGDVTGRFESKGVGGHAVDIEVNEARHAKSADFTAQSQFAEHTTLADLANLATFALETETLKTFIIEFSDDSSIKGSMEWNKENSTATITVNSVDLFKAGIVSVNDITEDDVKSFDTTKIYFDTANSALWFYDNNNWKNLNQHIADYLSALSDKDAELQQSTENNQAQITEHGTKLSELDSRVSDIELNTDLGQVTLRLNALDQKDIEHENLIFDNTNAIKENETAIQNNLNSINKLNTNLSELNTKVDVNKSQLDQEVLDLKAKDQELNSLIANVTSVNNEQNFDITSLKDKVTKHETTLVEHTSRLESIEETIPQHASSIETNATDITAIQDTLTEKLIDGTVNQKGFVKLSDTVSDNNDTALTPKAVMDYTASQFVVKGNATYDDIGKAGQMGFGQSACSDFNHIKECGFTPLQGTTDVNSDNYGVYLHKYGGLCCYIPKFWIRIGNESAPQYEKYKLNSIEIAKGDTFNSEEQAFEQGWFLPRAFIDGGKIKDGFFIQTTSARTNTQSTKDGVNYPTSNLTGSGIVSIKFHDMIDRAKTLGQGWNVCSAFMYSAVQLLTLAHAQMSDWYTSCGWYLSTRDYQFPNIGTNATSPQLTSHNGQKNGVQSFWHFWELVTGVTTAGTTATQGQTQVTDSSIYILKKEKSFADLTSGFGGDTDTWGTDTSLLSMYDKYTCPLSLTKKANVRWGNAEFSCLSSGIGEVGINELGRALCGVLPKDDNAVSSAGINMMNTSLIYLDIVTQNLALLCGGYTDSAEQGVFARTLCNWRAYSYTASSFRCARY